MSGNSKVFRRVTDVIFGISIMGFLIFSVIYAFERKEIRESTVAAKKVQERIEALVEAPIEVTVESDEIVSSDGVLEVMPKYQSLYEANNDMIGFIYIDDNYRFPILQKLDDQNYYLKHNFFKEDDYNGSIFANVQCELGGAGITLIYGHHIQGGNMFSCLDVFKNESYFENAEALKVDTLYSENSYRVAAVALCNMHDSFKYYDYVGSLSESTFELWRVLMGEKLIRGSLDGLSFEDVIIELSTCSYERDDNRLVVVLVKEQ